MTSSLPPFAVPAASRFILAGTIVTDGAVVPDALLAVDGERIAYAGPRDGFGDPAGYFGDVEHTRLPEGSFLLPGLIDLHCHGGNGGDFPRGEETSARKAIDFLHRSGTTTLLASLVTAPPDTLLSGVALYSRLTAEGLLAGIHLEGPFLSADRCGAQNPDYLLEPDPGLMADLLAAAGGHLATMTYAPELPGAGDLVDLLTSHGVVPSLGHTAADDATTAASLTAAREGLTRAGSAGRRLVPTVTHLFNGMPPLHHRSPGPVAACLRLAAAGQAIVELIADGTHLAPETVATVFGLVGRANIALVTDSMAAAGLADGRYMLGPSNVTVADGVATLEGSGAIAGGTATLLEVVRQTAAAGVPLPDAVYSATAVPAAVLGLTHEVGGLRRGLRADAVVTGPGLELTGVLRKGRWLPDPLD